MWGGENKINWKKLKSGGGWGGWVEGLKNPYRSSKKNYRDICLTL